MSVSKKIRFEVFKRDGFSCAYCGKSPPKVTLECDHIEPKSKGGSDDINNLITACFDCNRGKRNIPLDKAPAKLQENYEILKEKETQLAEYHKFIQKVERRVAREIKKSDAAYTENNPEYELSKKFKRGTVKKFLEYLPVQDVVDAMHSACNRVSDSSGCIKYFCGICWNKIKGKGFPNE